MRVKAGMGLAPCRRKATKARERYIVAVFYGFLDGAECSRNHRLNFVLGQPRFFGDAVYEFGLVHGSSLHGAAVAKKTILLFPNDVRILYEYTNEGIP